MSQADRLVHAFETQLAAHPYVERYLGPSLNERLGTETWFENRVIRYVLQSPAWVVDLEELFIQAHLDEIVNAPAIFAMRGSTLGYDEQLWDEIAEVRLARWLRIQGYDDIEKLVDPHNGTLPDFTARRAGEVALAEAKRVRSRDYLVEFVEDRLEGLALLAGRLERFGLRGESSSYDTLREDLAAGAAKERDERITHTRRVLTDEWLESLEQRLWHRESGTVGEILGIRFTFERVEHPIGRVSMSQGLFDTPQDKAKALLPRLNYRLTHALTQIRGYMDRATEGRTTSLAVVLVSGVDYADFDWMALWESMCRFRDVPTWAEVKRIRADASALIGIPWQLIVARGTSLEYGPFPWEPEGCGAL